MKKLLITVAALVGIATISYGQGVVAFGNAAVAARISTNTVVGGPSTGQISSPTGAAPNAFYFALFVAPSTQTTIDASLAGWTFTGNYGTNINSGRFNGNYTTDPGVTVAGFAPGSTANFAVVGWSGNIGHDWSVVLPWWQAVGATGAAPSVGLFGISGIAANQIVGGGAIPVPNLMGTVGAFTLGIQPVPEPATFALAGLGAAAMLIFRRRK